MIYITGDIHCPIDIRRLNSEKFIESKNLTKEDYLIILGDFGIPWYNPYSKEDLYWMKWFEEKPWTTLFVDGNHENHNTLDSLSIELWNGGKIHKINDSIYHLMRGQVFNIEDKTFFTFGGAESIDKSSRKIDVSWWERELPSNAEFDEALINLEKYNWNVDYILTHTASTKTIHNLFKYRIDSIYGFDSCNKFFDHLEDIVNFKHWYFGHWHDSGQLDDKHTVLYYDIIKIEKDDV